MSTSRPRGEALGERAGGQRAELHDGRGFHESDGDGTADRLALARETATSGSPLEPEAHGRASDQAWQVGRATLRGPSGPPRPAGRGDGYPRIPHRRPRTRHPRTSSGGGSPRPAPIGRQAGGADRVTDRDSSYPFFLLGLCDMLCDIEWLCFFCRPVSRWLPRERGPALDRHDDGASPLPLPSGCAGGWAKWRVRRGPCPASRSTPGLCSLMSQAPRSTLGLLGSLCQSLRRLVTVSPTAPY